MKRIILMLTVAAFMVAALTVTAAVAFAASGSQRECEGDGGTYTKDGPNSICEYPPVVVQGKNENQPKFQQTTEQTDTGHGNLNNRRESDTETTCNKPCPPGQFR